MKYLFYFLVAKIILFGDMTKQIKLFITPNENFP